LRGQAQGSESTAGKPLREIRVRATPRASQAPVADDPATPGRLRRHVTVPAVGGRADAAALLAAHFGVPKSRVRLVSGPRA